MTRREIQVIFKETEDFVIQRLLTGCAETRSRPIERGVDPPVYDELPRCCSLIFSLIHV